MLENLPRPPSSSFSCLSAPPQRRRRAAAMTSAAPALGRRGERQADARRPASFQTLPTLDRPVVIRQSDSHPELLRRPGGGPAAPFEGREAGQKLTKLLLNVTVQRSLGPVHVVMPPESAVADLIKAAVEAYVREGRRPLLPDADPAAFELHYSQFSLESLNREEKLINLGSRNFFLCHRPKVAAADCHGDGAKKAPSGPLLPLSRFMNTSFRQ